MRADRLPRRVVLASLLAGCGVPIRQARLPAGPSLAPPPPSAEEARVAAAGWSCPEWVVPLFPGVPQACGARPGEGVALAAVAGFDIAAGVALAVRYPGALAAGLDGGGAGALVPWIGLQDVWGYSLARHAMDGQLAAGLPYVPQDRLGELVFAPFNPRVLVRPAVVVPTLALAAAGVAYGVALGDPTGFSAARPNVFGASPPPGVGWTVYGASAVVLFEHVAIAEEAIFRGLLQSGLVRGTRSEVGGWALGTVVFGASHSLNALLLPPDERAQYLVYGVPFITAVGGVIGGVYAVEGYSLAPPVAMHFWYDVVVSGAAAVAVPGDTLFSIRTGGAF